MNRKREIIDATVGQHILTIGWGKRGEVVHLVLSNNVVLVAETGGDGSPVISVQDYRKDTSD